MSQSTCRAEINRANAQHSTGPKSAIGKLRSSQNSFQHGLYSKQLILPGEDPAEFDHLRGTLRNEHQPANTTEEILVDELAQHFWRMRRLQKVLGFVPSDSVGQTIGLGRLPSAEHIDQAELGFVPSDSIHILVETDQEVDFEPLAA